MFTHFSFPKAKIEHMANDKILNSAKQQELLQLLKHRFEANPNRHKGILWAKVLSKLQAKPAALWSLAEMEATSGEPDVIGYNSKTDEYTFCDCSAESPKERRSLCYDAAALASRKANKPANNAMDMANEMGVELLNEAQYRALQKLGPFDSKTSSWLRTPDAIRQLGGAIFGDYRFDTVFIYHNGAESYYAARGFRGLLVV